MLLPGLSELFDGRSSGQVRRTRVNSYDRAVETCLRMPRYGLRDDRRTMIAFLDMSDSGS